MKNNRINYAEMIDNNEARLINNSFLSNFLSLLHKIAIDIALPEKLLHLKLVGEVIASYCVENEADL